MRKLFLLILILLEMALFAQEPPTNQYGLYLYKSAKGYTLQDRDRLMANDSILPNTPYSHILQQSNCLTPYNSSTYQTTPLPIPQYQVSTKEVLLKKIKTRNLSVKVDLPVGADQPCPFIVFIHGGGWHIGNEEGLADQSHEFAANGIAGVRLSYTLVPEGGNIKLVLQELQDALKTVFKYARKWGLDTSRFGFYGDSAGGYLSSYMAMNTPGTKIYIGVCGMYDLTNISDGYFPGVEGRTKFFQTENTDSLKWYSPINRIPDNPPATLLMHGTADPTINCRQSQKFADAIRQKGGYAELALYEGYGHLFSLKKYSDCFNAALLKGISFAQKTFAIPSSRLYSNLFRGGDRTSFIGNSITHNGFHLCYLMLYYATRFPYMFLDFNNAGISGDTTEDIKKRMKTDILTQQPDVAVMMSGMNDAFRYVPITANDNQEEEKRKQSVDKYEHEYSEALASLLADGRRTVLFTPSIYDDKTAVKSCRSHHINPTLAAYADKVTSWGHKYHLPIVDMWKGLMDINQDILKDDPKASVIGYDRVHPSYFGGFMMVYLFLNELEGESFVSDVMIDVKRQTTQTQKARISEICYQKEGVSFDILEESLPFPIDSQIVKATKYVPFQEKMNRQSLKVKNLAEGNYELFIDNQFVGCYGHHDLNNGINLAENRLTPQHKQAEKISNLCEQLRLAFNDYRKLKLVEYQRIKTGCDFHDTEACLRQVNQLILRDTTANDWMKSLYKWYLDNKPKELTKLQHIADLKKHIYQCAQPNTHKYRILRVKKDTGFAYGADVSWLTKMEKEGYKFYAPGENNQEMECMKLLRDYCGVNSIRLRVWVNPKDGWNGTDDVIAKAMRAEKLGLRTMIDFHLSDKWADPGHQEMPEAWKELPFDSLKQTLDKYIKSVLIKLKKAGIKPEWIQIGNETTSGMMYPAGSVDNPRQLVALSNVGYDAVKSIFPQAKVIIHLDKGNDQWRYDRIFNIFENYGGKYDMIGMSLYPYWIGQQGEVSDWKKVANDCISNIKYVKQRYNKPVMLCEIGMPYNQPEACKLLIAQMMEAEVEGIFYWEPQAPKGYNGGYNLGCFDNGMPTIALDAFKTKQ